MPGTVTRRPVSRRIALLSRACSVSAGVVSAPAGTSPRTAAGAVHPAHAARHGSESIPGVSTRHAPAAHRSLPPCGNPRRTRSCRRELDLPIAPQGLSCRFIGDLDRVPPARSRGHHGTANPRCRRCTAQPSAPDPRADSMRGHRAPGQLRPPPRCVHDLLRHLLGRSHLRARCRAVRRTHRSVRAVPPPASWIRCRSSAATSCWTSGCGTGLCFSLLQERVGPGGTIVGVDAGAGDARASPPSGWPRHGWANVVLIESRVEDADAAARGPRPVLRRARRAAVRRRARPRPRARCAPAAVSPRAAASGRPAVGRRASMPGCSPCTRPTSRDFTGFDRPWALLAERVPGLAVREVAMGGGYVASGRCPPTGHRSGSFRTSGNAGPARGAGSMMTPVTVQKAVDLIGTGDTHPGRGHRGARPRAPVAGGHHRRSRCSASPGSVDGAGDGVPGRAAGVVHPAANACTDEPAYRCQRARSRASPGSRCRSGSTPSRASTCYVLADGDRVTVVDCGVWRPDLPDGGLAALEAGLEGAGYALRDVVPDRGHPRAHRPLRPGRPADGAHRRRAGDARA